MQRTSELAARAAPADAQLRIGGMKPRRSVHARHTHRQQRQHQHVRHQLQRCRGLGAPLLDLFGKAQPGVEEQRLVAVLKEFWKLWREPGREQAVEDRGRHDEQHHAAGDLVAGEFQEQGCGGKGREALQDGSQRKTFEPVQRARFRCCYGVHGGVSCCEDDAANLDPLARKRRD